MGIAAQHLDGAYVYLKPVEYSHWAKQFPFTCLLKTTTGPGVKPGFTMPILQTGAAITSLIP